MNKKERESYSFSKFSQLYFGQEIAFNQPSPPEPDIVFIHDNKKIGCELTTIFIDNIPGKRFSETKKKENLQRMIQKNVLDWLNNNVPKRFEVQLYFNGKTMLYSEVNNTTKKIIQIIENNISDLNLEESSRIKVQVHDQVPANLDYVRIRTFPLLHRNVVTDAGGSGIPILMRERIVSNINHKEARINKYKHLTDFNWLILIVNESLYSSEFEIVDEEYCNIDSLFDKVFIFSFNTQKILTIK